MKKAKDRFKMQASPDVTYICGCPQYPDRTPAEFVADRIVGGLGRRQPPAQRYEASDLAAPGLQAFDETQRCHVVNACNTM